MKFIVTREINDGDGYAARDMVLVVEAGSEQEAMTKAISYIKENDPRLIHDKYDEDNDFFVVGLDNLTKLTDDVWQHEVTKTDCC